MRFLFCLLSLVLFTACQSLPSPIQTQEADYGVFPDNSKEIAIAYLNDNLRDPETVEIQNVTLPIKRWIGDKVTGIKYGYLVCVHVNSKNIFGKMTGFRYDGLLIRNGEVIDYIKNGKLVSGMQLCN